MRTSISDLGESILGAVWWGASHVWGMVLGVMLLLAPLLLANLVAQIAGGMSATAAIAIGVVGAYVIGIPPWHAEGRIELLLVVAGATASVVGWELLHGTADAGTLLVAIALTVVCWPVRRAVGARFAG